MGGLFGGKKAKVNSILAGPAPAPAPVVTPPPPLPMPDDEAVAAAKRKSISRQKARRGRTSTIFTGIDEGERLGG